MLLAAILAGVLLLRQVYNIIYGIRYQYCSLEISQDGMPTRHQRCLERMISQEIKKCWGSGLVPALFKCWRSCMGNGFVEISLCMTMWQGHCCKEKGASSKNTGATHTDARGQWAVRMNQFGCCNSVLFGVGYLRLCYPGD